MIEWVQLPGSFMFRSLCVSLLYVATSIVSFGQDANPQQPVITLHTKTQLVVVDVVVTDKSRKPVQGLKASDFSLLEDGNVQTVRSFEEHREIASGKELQPAPTMPPGFFTNYTVTPADQALNVLLLDTLNTSVTDQIYLKDQILKFLTNAKPGAPIAIFGLTTRLTLLQSFTSDPEVLRIAINKKKGSFSPLMDDPASGGSRETLADDYAAFAVSTNRSSMGSNGALQTMENAAVQQAGATDKLRAQYTLSAINQLGRYLAGMPGRKNLIWFSGSFPIDIMPDDENGDFANMEQEFHETANLLTRAQVAVYPIDARGAHGTSDVDGSRRVSGIGSADIHQEQLNFHAQIASSEQITMLRMAKETGGKSSSQTMIWPAH
jgi:VWFA-related protein